MSSPVRDFAPPRARADSAGRRASPSGDVVAAAAAAEAAPAGKVLVVEDNPVNLIVMLEMLRVFGVEALEAEHGAAALEVVAAERVGLVLMDCNMPVMDGYEAARRIREREARLGLARLPVVAVTANALGGNTARVLAAGMDGLLAKPYTQAQLRAVLERWAALPR